MGKCLFVLVPVLMLVVSSCKKVGAEPAITEKKLFGTYQFIKMTYQEVGSAEKNVTDDYFIDCQKDDLIVLSASRTYTAVDAGVTCGKGNLVSAWSLLGTNTLKLGDDLYTIRKYDGTNLELSLTGDNRGVSTTLVRYYVKQ